MVGGLPAGGSGGAFSDAATGGSTFNMLVWPTGGSSCAERSGWDDVFAESFRQAVDTGLV